MKIKILFATVLTLASFTAGYAQALDKGKLDQFFDRLAEKTKAMGSLTIAKDGLGVRSGDALRTHEPSCARRIDDRRVTKCRESACCDPFTLVPSPRVLYQLGIC